MSSKYEVMYVIPQEEYTQYMRRKDEEDEKSEECSNHHFIQGDVEAKQLGHVEIGSANNIEFIAENCPVRRRKKKDESGDSGDSRKGTKPSFSSDTTKDVSTQPPPTSSRTIGVQGDEPKVQEFGTQASIPSQSVLSQTERPSVQEQGTQSAPIGQNVEIQTDLPVTRTLGLQALPQASTIGIQTFVPTRQPISQIGTQTLDPGVQSIGIQAQTTQAPQLSTIGTQAQLPSGPDIGVAGSSRGFRPVSSSDIPREQEQRSWIQRLVPSKQLFSEETFDEAIADREILSSTPVPTDPEAGSVGTSQYYTVREDSPSKAPHPIVSPVPVHRSPIGGAVTLRQPYQIDTDFIRKQARMRSLMDYMKKLTEKEMLRRSKKKLQKTPNLRIGGEHQQQRQLELHQEQPQANIGVAHEGQQQIEFQGEQQQRQQGQEEYHQQEQFQQQEEGHEEQQKHKYQAGYKCPVCLRVFTRKDNLKRHLQRGKCSKKTAVKSFVTGSVRPSTERTRPTRTLRKGTAQLIGEQIRTGSLHASNPQNLPRSVMERVASELTSGRGFRQLRPSARVVESGVQELSRTDDSIKDDRPTVSVGAVPAITYNPTQPAPSTSGLEYVRERSTTLAGHRRRRVPSINDSNGNSSMADRKKAKLSSRDTRKRKKRREDASFG